MCALKVICGGQLNENSNFGLLETKDSRAVFKKIKDVVRAAFNFFKVLAVKGIRSLSIRNIRFAKADCIQPGVYRYNAEVLPWRASNESKGLYLFIHGLRGSPTDWHDYLEEIKEKDPGAHRFAPEVPLKGNCALETAAKPLLAAVESYLKKFPGQPIHLIGTSNGGRIAAYLESHLDPDILGTSRLSVVSLAGVHYGTKVMDRMKKMGLLPLARLHKTLAEEFSFGSQTAREHLSLWKEKQTVWNERQISVRHLFCASTEDEQVRSLASSLPYHAAAVSDYRLVHGESHASIVDGMRHEVLQWLSTA